MTRLGTGLSEAVKAAAKARSIADQFGLRTADTLPAPDTDERRRNRSAVERRVEEALGIGVVAIIGHAARVPRSFGDNEGGQAVAVKTSTDPRFVFMAEGDARVGGLASVEDRQQPFQAMAMVELARVYVASRRHATLFKTALDSVLLGTTAKARHRWRDVPVSFDMDMLPLLFGQAAEDAGVAFFDCLERDRKKAAAMRREGKRK